MPRQRAPKLPKAIQDALGGLPAVAPRLNGLATPPLGLADLRKHAAALKEICAFIGLGPDSAVLVLEAMAKQRDFAVALVQLAASACRMDITGGDQDSERSLHEIAHGSLRLVGEVVVAAASGASTASRAARAVAADLAWSILKGQNLQAAAKQLAAAAAVLASPEQQAGLSAGSLGRLRLRAGQMAGVVMFPVGNLACLMREYEYRALTAALLTALRESRLLEHTGRLLLLLPPGPGEGPASEDLAEAQRSAHLYLCHTVLTLRDMLQSAGSSPGSELKLMFGSCGLHALLALGASTLAAADGGPCGLPRDPLLRRFRETPFPTISGESIVALACALTANLQSPAPSLSARARIRLHVRVLQLAGASARAGRGALVRTPDGKRAVDLSWSGRRRRSSQDFARLLGPGRIAEVAGFAISELITAVIRSPRTWAAEAPALLPALFTGARHCLAMLAEGADPMVESSLVGAVAHLLTTVAGGLRIHGKYIEGLPRPMAAALEGGVVPLLETLLRGAGDDPAGPEAQLVEPVVCSNEPCASLFALLVHSPPRQAAAFLATLAKLLRRTPLAALLEPVGLGGPLPPGVWLSIAGCFLLFVANPGTGREPPGPVDPSAPCSPFFVLSLAALQLLPVVSRLTREAAQLPPTAAPGAARSGGQDDSNEAGRKLMRVLIEGQLRIVTSALLRLQEPRGRLSFITGALRRLLGAGGPAPEGPLSTALCLPFLVEEAGAVPLLGALLAALLRDGELPGQRPTPPDQLVQLAQCCVGVAKAYPERVRGEGSGSGSSGAGGNSGASASAAWSPAALRLLASRLRGSEPQLSKEVEALAAWREQPAIAGAPPEVSPGAVAELAAAAERLVALRAEVRAVLPPACSNPACVSLAGDSEAGLRLQQCSRCGRASYCCRECQVAHWKAGHKEACGGGGGSS